MWGAAWFGKASIMTVVQQVAAEITKSIADRFAYFSNPEKQAITDLIVSKFSPFVEEPQRGLAFEDQVANDKQSGAILALLKARRSAGAVTHELAKLALKYSSRIAELRHQQHYKITAVHESGRTWRYFLDPADW